MIGRSIVKGSLEYTTTTLANKVPSLLCYSTIVSPSLSVSSFSSSSYRSENSTTPASLLPPLSFHQKSQRFSPGYRYTHSTVPLHNNGPSSDNNLHGHSLGWSPVGSLVPANMGNMHATTILSVRKNGKVVRTSTTTFSKNYAHRRYGREMK